MLHDPSVCLLEIVKRKRYRLSSAEGKFEMTNTRYRYLRKLPTIKKIVFIGLSEVVLMTHSRQAIIE